MLTNSQAVVPTCYNSDLFEPNLGVTILPAAKSDRASIRRRERNQPLRSRVRTFIRNARQDIDNGDLDDAEQAVKSAVVALDKAAAKGALHPNNAARRKSRLMSQLSKARNS